MVPRDGGKPVLAIHRAPHADSADAESYPPSHYLVCSLVLPCEVGGEGTVVSVPPETRGD